MRTVAISFFLLILALTGCARKVDTPSFKESLNAYDKDFNAVWNACLNAVEDQTIEQADKALKQIITKPSSGNIALGVAGNTLKYTTIKISEKRPYKIRVKVLMTHKSASIGGPLGWTQSTEDYSVLEDEQNLLRKIDETLK